MFINPVSSGQARFPAPDDLGNGKGCGHLSSNHYNVAKGAGYRITNTENPGNDVPTVLGRWGLWSNVGGECSDSRSPARRAAEASEHIAEFVWNRSNPPFLISWQHSRAERRTNWDSLCGAVRNASQVPPTRAATLPRQFQVSRFFAVWRAVRSHLLVEY